MEERLEAAYQALFEGDFERARDLEKSLEDQSFERWNLQSYLAVEEQDFARARQAMETYLERAKEEQDRVHEHIAYHQLGYVERSAGNLELALQWIEMEAEFLNMYFPGDHYRQSVNFYEQGYLRLLLGNVETAEKWMQQALDYALESQDLVNQGCAYRGMGEIKQAEGNSDQARDYFQQAKDLFEQAEDFIGAEEVEEMLSNF